MSDWHAYSIAFDRRRPQSVLLPAVLFSVAVHAAAGGLLFSGWPRAPVEPPQPLTVTLVAAPPQPAIEIPQPQRAARNPERLAASNRVVSAPPVNHAPAPSPVAVERVESAPSTATPAPEIAPAPAIVANAPAAVNSAGRADTIDLPHFNVAYLVKPQPVYPPVARKLGLEGLVMVRVYVSATGMPEQVAVAQSSGAPVLDEEALRAVRDARFVPARRGDTPDAHVVEVPIRYQLNKN